MKLTAGKNIRFVFLAAVVFATGCASKPLQAPVNAKEVLAQKEYEDVMKVQEITPSGEYVRLPGPEP